MICDYFQRVTTFWAGLAFGRRYHADYSALLDLTRDRDCMNVLMPRGDQNTIAVE
ncbi:MAG: hypothetical protein JOZ16_09555 [Methylobacteriaceae bacterium]|nr:hypothetical protein [Methylobacteriaceae bacterium]